MRRIVAIRATLGLSLVAYLHTPIHDESRSRSVCGIFVSTGQLITVPSHVVAAVFDRRSRPFRMSLNGASCLPHATILKVTVPLPAAKFLICTIRSAYKTPIKTGFYQTKLKRFRDNGRSGFVAWDTSDPVSRVVDELFELGALFRP
jgi:hypothetical protein